MGRRRDWNKPERDGTAAHAILPLGAAQVWSRIHRLKTSAATVAPMAGMTQAELLCILARRANCDFDQATRIARALGMRVGTVEFGDPEPDAAPRPATDAATMTDRG